jgi:site-specific DNA-methyltransferase (adenine-specific)
MKFAEFFVGNFSQESVLDLFGGTGTTLIACEQLNRKCYMMEMSPQYVDLIIDRWETFTGKKAELIGNYGTDKHE